MCIRDRSIIGGPLSSKDEAYFEGLKLKYASNENIKFLGSIPHKNLINKISNLSFHINNTEQGFFDKSVLETMSHGLINFYSNSDYDELLPKKYVDKFKFDGTSESLSNKISNIGNLKKHEINEIINYSQSKLEKQSVNNLVERVLAII